MLGKTLKIFLSVNNLINGLRYKISRTGLPCSHGSIFTTWFCTCVQKKNF
jgi:hypothetical protein